MAAVTGLYNDYWNLPRVKPNYQATIESFDKISQFKDQQYQKAYSYINALRKTSLDIQLMNDTFQGKVNDYNKELDGLFKNEDLRGKDLADGNISNKYIGWFDKIASDTTLQQVIKYDANWRQQIAEKKEMAKNPAKTGYADSNYTVWLNKEGGLMEYLNATDASFLSKPPPVYTPYYDVWKDLGTILKNAHPTKTGYDIPETVKDENGNDIPTGRMTHVTYEEISEGRLNALFGMLPDQARTQLEINEQAQFYSTFNSIDDQNKPEYLERVKTSVNTQRKAAFDMNLKSIDKDIQTMKNDIAYLESQGNIAEVESRKERLIKMEYERTRYASMEAPDASELTGLGVHDIAHLYGKHNAQTQLMGFASNLAWKDEQRSIKSLPGYNEDRLFQLNEARFRHKQNIDYAQLKINEYKAMKAAGLKADGTTDTFEDANGLSWTYAGEGVIGGSTDVLADWGSTLSEYEAVTRLYETTPGSINVDNFDQFWVDFLTLHGLSASGKSTELYKMYKKAFTEANVTLDGSITNLTAAQKEEVLNKLKDLSNIPFKNNSIEKAVFTKAANAHKAELDLTLNSIVQSMGLGRIKVWHDGSIKIYNKAEKEITDRGQIDAVRDKISQTYAATTNATKGRTQLFSSDKDIDLKKMSMLLRTYMTEDSTGIASEYLKDAVIAKNSQGYVISGLKTEKKGSATIKIGDNIYTINQDGISLGKNPVSNIFIPVKKSKAEVYVEALTSIFQTARVLDIEHDGIKYFIKKTPNGTFNIVDKTDKIFMMGNQYAQGLDVSKLTNFLINLESN